jgi:TolB-like protein
VVIGALLFYVFVRPNENGASQPLVQEASVTAARRAAADPHGAISVAVLPFANLSSDKEQEFFSDGITDEISGALAKIPDLRVVGRASAFQYKNRANDLRAVGQSLGATHLIEGSVRKAGNRVRISAELVQADNGIRVWSDNYERDLTDVFAIQEDIAQAIAVSLRMPLGLKPGEALVNSRTKDEGLHEEYLKALALVRTRSIANNGRQGIAELTEAAQRLEKVLAREPDYAPGWALLAYAYGYIPLRGLAGKPPDEVAKIVAEVMPKAEAAAKRAIAIDPKSAGGYFALGFIQHVRANQLAAMESFAQGMAIDPTNPDGLHIYSDTLADLGYVKKSLPLRRQLQALEPFVAVYQAITGRIEFAAGDYDGFIAKSSSAPGPIGPLAAAQGLSAKGLYREAADKLQSSALPGSDAAAQLLRTAPAKADPKKLPDLDRLTRFIYPYVGAPERFMVTYEEELKIGYVGPGNNVWLWAPTYASVRQTDRFKAYVRAAGILDFWRKNGWPDLCHAAGADDFVCE